MKETVEITISADSSLQELLLVDRWSHENAVENSDLNGVFLMSGLMRKDRDTLLATLSNEVFHPIKEDYVGDWWAVASKRKEDS